jgi:hypothetical protein
LDESNSSGPLFHPYSKSRGREKKTHSSRLPTQPPTLARHPNASLRPLLLRVAKGAPTPQLGSFLPPTTAWTCLPGRPCRCSCPSPPPSPPLTFPAAICASMRRPAALLCVDAQARRTQQSCCARLDPSCLLSTSSREQHCSTNRARSKQIEWGRLQSMEAEASPTPPRHPRHRFLFVGGGKAPFPEHHRPPSSSIRRRSSSLGRRRRCAQSELALGRTIVPHLARSRGRSDPRQGARAAAASAVVGELRWRRLPGRLELARATPPSSCSSASWSQELQ